MDLALAAVVGLAASYTLTVVIMKVLGWFYDRR
jgi:hypothetical protein